MKAAVFGAGGFVGGHLVDHLQRLDWDVRPILRGDDSWRGEALGHVFFCVGLTADFRARPFDAIDAHVGFAVDVLRHAQFESFLYCSSTRVYAKSTAAREDALLSVDPNDPSDLYNLSKLMGEAACLATPRPQVRVARLSNVIGADPTSENFLNSIVRDAVTSGVVKLQTGLGSAKDYIAIDEVVNAMARIAMDGSQRLYNIASGHNTSHAQVLDAVQAATGCNVETLTGAPVMVFPPISIERLTELGVSPRAGVVDLMPGLVEAMRRHVAGRV